MAAVGMGSYGNGAISRKNLVQLFLFIKHNPKEKSGYHVEIVHNYQVSFIEQKRIL